MIAAAIAIVASLLAGLPASAAPRAGTTVTGTWTVGQGEVKVTSSGSSYVGVVSKAIAGFGCSHPVGEQIWTFSGSGPEFTGQARLDLSQSCPNPMANAKFTLLSPQMLQVNYVGPTGLSATMYIAYQMPGGASTGSSAGGTDTSPPVIEAIGSGTPIPLGGKRTLQYRVSDDSGKARVRMALYSDGVVAAAGDTQVQAKATGQLQTATLKADPTAKGNFGPYYFCVWAEDKAGNRSAGWPQSSCAWRPIEVDMKALVKANKVNACGPNTGYASTVAWNLLLNVRTFGGIPVSFSGACNAHDAGYWGYAFKNPVTGQVVDTRSWSRNDVDNEFRNNFEALCDLRLTGHPDLLADCKTNDTYGATAYFVAVDHGGRNGFDANATMPGTQHEMPATTNPAGGGRNPGDPR